MPDNTNVNNNAAVVVVGRTAPVPPGQQKSEKSIPVVIASDQSTIPVAEQNKVQSEVALSLLGIPRSEVALGIFADVNTYDVNPTEWSATPEQYSTIPAVGAYAGIAQTMGWGLSHIPEESGALIEAPADRSAVLTSKRFFRYQPGRVSAATFGVKTTLIADTGADVQNPCVRKYGIFDNYDGYYWESRNDGEKDNFSVVRRTQSIIYENPLTFGSGAGQQSQDYGRTNPTDPLAPRGSEAVGITTNIVTPKKFGDLVILRDNLLMTHAAVYDQSLLQSELRAGITSVYNGNTVSFVGLAKSITNAVYDINTGLMVVTTGTNHGYDEGRFVFLSGIGMTCYLDPINPKLYPNRSHGFNVLTVNSPTSFTVNIGVSTVPTYFKNGGYVVGLSTGQFVGYSKGTNTGVITGFTDTKTYRITSVGINTNTGITTVTLANLDGTNLTTLTSVTGISSHVLVTPVPFVQPVSGSLINATRTKYTTIMPTGMFPYMYKDADGNTEGYIDTTLGSALSSTLKDQIDAVNTYYNKWVNQNVKKDFWNVYEYRIPRSRFSGDRLDGTTDNLLYSDVVSDKRAGEPVLDEDTLEQLEDTSIWNIDLTKVTMYKIEFSWYGAVGALFLAYVPVSNGEARWVRVHHLRASNQLKVSSLGNATLPITYMVYGGGNVNNFGYPNAKRIQSAFDYGTSSEHIVKYGASYYIDGGDRGTVKLFSYSTPTSQSVYGSKKIFFVNNGGGVGVASTQVDLTNATSATDPYIVGHSTVASSFYVGSKIITTNPLDQNIEITFVNTSNQRMYLNSPLNSTSLASITVIPNRTVPLVGLKCRDFIQSSTGRNVRNRTQVYPTRLSTGSTGLLKIDLLKSPIFQTSFTVLTPTASPVTLTSPVNIGKRGNPTLVGIATVVYTGGHQFVSATSNGITKTAGGTLTATTGTTYNGSTGTLTIVTTTTHGLTTGNTISLAEKSLSFTCSLDNYATVHQYPRTTDPSYLQNLSVTVINTTTFTVNIGVAAAEYIRDIGGGTYGYFRGYFENDPTQKPISVLGYLENRGSDRTKGVQTDGYYFYALKSTSDNIILNTTDPFLREENVNSLAQPISPNVSEFTLAQLSSIKISPELRSPIPGTGTVVASLYVPASGQEYDLSPYFDYNKEYLSFPLTNKIESLYLCASSQTNFVSGTPAADISASITWEEQ